MTTTTETNAKGTEGIVSQMRAIVAPQDVDTFHILQRRELGKRVPRPTGWKGAQRATEQLYKVNASGAKRHRETREEYELRVGGLSKALKRVNGSKWHLPPPPTE